MSEPQAAASSADPPAKRSVFRPEVLQREVDRRDSLIALREVPGLPAWVGSLAGLGLILAMAGLLSVTVTFRAGTAERLGLLRPRTPQSFALQLRTNYPNLLTRGRTIGVELSGAPPVLLEVQDAAGTNRASPVSISASTARGASANSDAFAPGTPHPFTLQTSFLQCLKALVSQP